MSKPRASAARVAALKALPQKSNDLAAARVVTFRDGRKVTFTKKRREPRKETA